MSAAAQRFALSFDDGFNPAAEPRAANLNALMLRALAEQKVRTAFFVSGSRVDSDEGLKLVQAWSGAGHLVANHGYSHLNLNRSKVTLKKFIDDAKENEAFLVKLAQGEKRFRFPYLKEGDLERKRDGFRQWLRLNNYDSGAMFRVEGWEIINPSEAYRDAVYAKQPEVLPAGESIIWSLAKQAGIPNLRYPAEDGVYGAPKLDALGL